MAESDWVGLGGGHFCQGGQGGLPEEVIFEPSCAVMMGGQHVQRPWGVLGKADQPVSLEWREAHSFREMSGKYSVVCMLEGGSFIMMQ